MCAAKRVSGFSRIVQVLRTITSACSCDAASPSPIDSSMPLIRSESWAFIWQPNVVTWYRFMETVYARFSRPRCAFWAPTRHRHGTYFSLGSQWVVGWGAPAYDHVDGCGSCGTSLGRGLDEGLGERRRGRDRRALRRRRGVSLASVPRAGEER